MRSAWTELEKEALISARAKDALQESEERYRMIFNNSPLGIIHFDQKGVIVDCNEHFLEIMGGTREAIIGFNMVASIQDEAMRRAVLAGLSASPGYLRG